MKSKFITLLLTVLTIVSCKPRETGNKQDLGNGIYRLFPTKNYWTFIKLDTRNGKMWQVHFTVSDDAERIELILNPHPLVTKEKEAYGRFTLYPTENIYNFLLLDQIVGSVYQVQWSMEEKGRAIIQINK
jgi:hypothetical protein